MVERVHKNDKCTRTCVCICAYMVQACTCICANNKLANKFRYTLNYVKIYHCEKYLLYSITVLVCPMWGKHERQESQSKHVHAKKDVHRMSFCLIQSLGSVLTFHVPEGQDSK